MPAGTRIISAAGIKPVNFPVNSPFDGFIVHIACSIKPSFFLVSFLLKKLSFYGMPSSHMPLFFSSVGIRLIVSRTILAS